LLDGAHRVLATFPRVAVYLMIPSGVNYVAVIIAGECARTAGDSSDDSSAGIDSFTIGATANARL
jgi:hypothetical protein